LGFVSCLKSKEDLIVGIRNQELYDNMADDSKILSKKDVKLYGRERISGMQLIEMTAKRSDLLHCLKLAGNILKAKELYENLDIVELWEDLTLLYAYEYNDPTLELTETEENNE